MKTAIIHDCDPGNDDALGIFVAVGDPGLDLVAVTTGAGHLDSARTAGNAAIAAALTSPCRFPVAAGATGPLVRERLIAGILDQESALDPKRDELPSVALDPRHSADLIAELAAQRPGLVVVATGPLTNLALALRRHPQAASAIGRIVSLGGAWGLGNKTPSAEWNILCDPEAAAIVYGAGIPITMIPVDAAAAAVIDLPLVAAVEALRGPAATFAVELMNSLRKTYRRPIFGPADAPMNDPVALLVAADASLARTVPARVDIELAGRFTYGRSVVDFSGALPPNCDVVISLEVDPVRQAFLAALARLDRMQSETHQGTTFT